MANFKKPTKPELVKLSIEELIWLLIVDKSFAQPYRDEINERATRLGLDFQKMRIIFDNKTQLQPEKQPVKLQAITKPQPKVINWSDRIRYQENYRQALIEGYRCEGMNDPVKAMATLEWVIDYGDPMGRVAARSAGIL